MNFKKAAIVFNPKGGSACQKTVNEIVSGFRKHGLEITSLKTTPEPHSGAKLARQAVGDGADLLISFGGDGTFGEVTTGVGNSDVTVVNFPGGTGNVWARAHYCDPTPAEFVEMVMNGVEQRPNAIRAVYKDLQGVEHEQLLWVGFGAGPAADAISTASSRLKRIFGQVFYVFNVIKSCLRPSARRFRLKTVSGDKSTNASAVLAINITPPFMSSLSLGCSAHDGLMDLVVFEANGFWQMLSMAFWIAIRRPQKSKYYKRMRVKEVVITSEHPLLPNLDGDAGQPCNEIKLIVEPGPVKMILC